MSLRISFFQDNGRYLRHDYTFLSTMEFFTNDLARPCCSLLANRNGKKLQRRCTPSLAVNKQRNEPRENTNDREKKQYPYYSRLQNLFVDPRCLRSISGFTITRVETPRSRIYLLVLPGSLTWPRELSRISYANRCAFPTNRPICKTRLRSARMVDSIAFFSFFFFFFLSLRNVVQIPRQRDRVMQQLIYGRTRYTRSPVWFIRMLLFIGEKSESSKWRVDGTTFKERTYMRIVTFRRFIKQK